MDTQMQNEYQRWLQLATEDEDLIRELKSIAGKEDEIYDRFYRELSFGTAGLRGIIGAGSNRMNIYTVRKATQGLADYLKQQYTEAAVAISFDSRIKSELFAREAARTLAANGIRVYLTDQLQPTPFLSFAVRTLNCQAGVMITASHNPSKYNGYKCYGPDGCQMTDHSAGAVTECISKLDIFHDVKTMDFDAGLAQGLIQFMPAELMDRYLQAVLACQVNSGIPKDNLKVIYTPLNGTGYLPVTRILSMTGVTDVTVVPEQRLPDGNFPTAPYPNPEIREAFNCAFKLAETVPADLLLATDPDADRVGIAVLHKGEYVLLTGNEIGCLLFHYILSCKHRDGTLPQNPVAVKTIVSSELIARIAEKYGVELINVLTGFKYIGEQILLLEQAGTAERFVFGFEESYGYLSGTYVRDKDAVYGAMIICEMAAYYKAQGKTLLDVLQELYEEFGYYAHHVINSHFEGAEGMAAMQQLMDRLRQNPPAEIAGFQVLRRLDYLQSVETDCTTGQTAPIHLPKSNVLSFQLEGNNGVIIRPSGTEPKIKVYITAVGTDRPAADHTAEVLTQAANALLPGKE